jgi:hypothetical protein
MKKEKLSPLIEQHFRQWISVELWYVGHPLDEERFYRFVWCVIRLSRKPPSEEFIRNLIIAEWEGKLESTYLSGKAIHYSGLYATLSEFAKARSKG